MKPDLDAIRARCDAATPGPWTYDEAGYVDVGLPRSRSIAIGIEIDATAKSDGDFIAHARTDIPALLAHIEELESRVTYTVGETEWAMRIAVAEQRFVDEYDRRKASSLRNAMLEERALTAEERLERVTHERDQERTVFEQENLALRRELARIMDDH